MAIRHFIMLVGRTSHEVRELKSIECNNCRQRFRRTSHEVRELKLDNIIIP